MAEPREVVYGRNPVREAVAAGRRRVHEIHCLPDLVREDWGPRAPAPARADRARLGRLAGSSDHQGVVATVDPYPYVDEADLLAGEGRLICLDGVQDPRNLGAVCRVAEAAGIAGVVIPSRGSPGVTPAVAKTSAGAVEHLAICRVDNLPRFLHDLGTRGRTSHGADAERGRDYREVDWPPDAVLVMGGEGEGLRPRVRERCHELVAIPMAGRVGSLNLSVATALLAFEAIRAR